jgi:hypothetical protein
LALEIQPEIHLGLNQPKVMRLSEFGKSERSVVAFKGPSSHGVLAGV